MRSNEFKAAAQRTGCTLIDQNIALSDLNQMLIDKDSSNEQDTKDRLFADFLLGQQLRVVAVIGTKHQLEQLKFELAL
jgi:hypothetical protein